jgi:uncharacterized cupin superfamily protein
MSELEILRFAPKGPADAGLAPTAEITPDMIEEGSPIERAHNYYTSPSGVLSAGVWECTPFRTKLLPTAVDEFMLVLEGSVTIAHEDGHEETFRAGDAFVIPRGLRCAWKQTENIRKYYVIYEDSKTPLPEKPVAERAIRLEPQGPAGKGLTPLELPDTSIFVGDPPTQHDHTYFEDATDQMYAGTWTCTPMHRKPITFARTELMCLLEGSVTLTDGTGKAHAFRAPDCLLVPHGTVITWDSDEDVRKFYCIFEESGVDK